MKGVDLRTVENPDELTEEQRQTIYSARSNVIFHEETDDGVERVRVSPPREIEELLFGERVQWDNERDVRESRDYQSPDMRPHGGVYGFGYGVADDRVGVAEVYQLLAKEYINPRNAIEYVYFAEELLEFSGRINVYFSGKVITPYREGPGGVYLDGVWVVAPVFSDERYNCSRPSLREKFHTMCDDFLDRMGEPTSTCRWVDDPEDSPLDIDDTKEIFSASWT